MKPAIAKVRHAIARLSLSEKIPPVVIAHLKQTIAYLTHAIARMNILVARLKPSDKNYWRKLLKWHRWLLD